MSELGEREGRGTGLTGQPTNPSRRAAWSNGTSTNRHRPNGSFPSFDEWAPWFQHSTSNAKLPCSNDTNTRANGDHSCGQSAGDSAQQQERQKNRRLSPNSF